MLIVNPCTLHRYFPCSCGTVTVVLGPAHNHVSIYSSFNHPFQLLDPRESHLLWDQKTRVGDSYKYDALCVRPLAVAVHKTPMHFAFSLNFALMDRAHCTIPSLDELLQCIMISHKGIGIVKGEALHFTFGISLFRAVTVVSWSRAQPYLNLLLR